MPDTKTRAYAPIRTKWRGGERWELENREADDEEGGNLPSGSAETG